MMGCAGNLRFPKPLLAAHGKDHESPPHLPLKTLHRGESVLALGFLHTAHSPCCRARLWRELRDVGQLKLSRGKGRAMGPQVWAIRQQGRMTHKGRVRYQGHSFRLIAGAGNPPAHEGYEKTSR